MGRHRIYNTNADRQRAYRERVAARTVVADPRTVELNQRVQAQFEKTHKGQEK